MGTNQCQTNCNYYELVLTLQWPVFGRAAPYHIGMLDFWAASDYSALKCLWKRLNDGPLNEPDIASVALDQDRAIHNVTLFSFCHLQSPGLLVHESSIQSHTICANLHARSQAELRMDDFFAQLILIMDSDACQVKVRFKHPASKHTGNDPSTVYSSRSQRCRQQCT